MLAHDMSEEERLGVWSAQPEAGAAWDKLSAELDDATATDPLAAGWGEEDADGAQVLRPVRAGLTAAQVVHRDQGSLALQRRSWPFRQSGD